MINSPLKQATCAAGLTCSRMVNRSVSATHARVRAFGSACRMRYAAPMRIVVTASLLLAVAGLPGCKKKQSSGAGVATAQPDEVAQGSALLQSGEFDRALAHFDKAIAAAPNDARPRVYRASVYSKKQQYDRAIAD